MTIKVREPLGNGRRINRFLKGTFHPGINLVLDAVQLQAHLAGAQLVITGEGKSDLQTLHGKAPLGVAKAAKQANVEAMCCLEELIERQMQHYKRILQLLSHWWMRKLCAAGNARTCSLYSLKNKKND